MFALAGYISEKNSDVEKMLNSLSDFSEGKTEICKEAGAVFGIKQLSPRFGGNSVRYESAPNLLIAFRGRIYDREKLIKELGISPATDDDAEIVALGYEKIGKRISSEIRGMFAFALYDTAQSTLVLSRDACGMRTVYYAFDGESFIFASGTRAFGNCEFFEKELNEKALSAFLCFGSVATDETLIKGVYRLEPGHTLVYKNGSIEKECFFDLVFKDNSESEEEIIDEIHETAERTIERATRGANFATFLSGGVDSSYIASVAKPKVTYTAGYSDAKYDETVHTKELADALGIENKVKIVTPEEFLACYKDVIRCLDEPLSNPSIPSIYLGSACIGEDVIISGEGADELFAGYHSYNEEISHRGYMKLPYALRHLIYLATRNFKNPKFDFFARRGQKLSEYYIGIARIFSDRDAMDIVNCKNQIRTKDITEKYFEKYKNESTMRQRQGIDYRFWLINDFIQCVARCAEKYGVESRFPLCDKEIVEVAAKLPDGMKLRGGLTKWAFRMASKKVIPTDAHSRRKLGFPVPLKGWIAREDYYNELKAKFESETGRRFFNAEKTVALLDDHKNGKCDNYRKLWALYTFIVWYDLNF